MDKTYEVMLVMAANQLESFEERILILQTSDTTLAPTPLDKPSVSLASFRNKWPNWIALVHTEAQWKRCQ
jgi:hypothetical protein